MKTKLLIICYIFLLTFSSCKTKPRTPDNVLDEERMTALLIDIYVAESKVNNLKLSRDSSMAIFEVYEGELFDKHAVDDSTYRRSMTYYYDHPKQLEEIYGTVFDSLKIREEKLKEAREQGTVDKDEKSDKKKVEKDKD